MMIFFKRKNLASYSCAYCILPGGGGGGGGGGGQFFFEFLFLLIFWFSEQWIFFECRCVCGHHKTGLFWGREGLFIYILGLFLKAKKGIWNIFWGGGGIAKFKICFGYAWYSWYFFGWTVDAGSKPTYPGKLSVPQRGIYARIGVLISTMTFVTISITFYKTYWQPTRT